MREKRKKQRSYDFAPKPKRASGLMMSRLHQSRTLKGTPESTVPYHPTITLP
jgi:hypothetical protein